MFNKKKAQYSEAKTHFSVGYVLSIAELRHTFQNNYENYHCGPSEIIFNVERELTNSKRYCAAFIDTLEKLNNEGRPTRTHYGMVNKENCRYKLVEFASNEIRLDNYIPTETDMEEGKQFKVVMYHSELKEDFFVEGNFGSIEEANQFAKETIREHCYDVACIYRLDEDEMGNLEKVIKKIDLEFSFVFYNVREYEVVIRNIMLAEYNKKMVKTEVMTIRDGEEITQNINRRFVNPVREIRGTEDPDIYEVVFEYKPNGKIASQLKEKLEADLAKLRHKELKYWLDKKGFISDYFPYG